MSFIEPVCLIFNLLTKPLATAGDSSKQESEEAQDVEIEGFDFKTLRKLNPDLSPGLTTFRNHLQETTNEMRPMKIWQLQDLSFQVIDKCYQK